MISFIIDEKGEEVISDRHQSDYKKEGEEEVSSSDADADSEETSTSSFTDVNFDDI